MLHCPNRDGLLKKHAQTSNTGLQVTYHRCPACRGFWLTSFSANYIQDIVESPTSRNTHPLTFNPSCPECRSPLTHARAESLAPGVNTWRCEKGHGYFFPSGELTKFKQAQQAKLSYHKLWNIPLPSVASVLLASFAILLLSTAALVANVRQKQIIESQAQSIFQSQRAIFTTKGVTFITSTNLPAAVTLFVEVEGKEGIAMDTADGLTHTTTISTLPPGSYEYYFLIERNGQRSITEQFTIQIP